MKIVIGKGLFETNSSSSHSLKNKEFAISSTSEERYKLENNVIDMFNKVKI